MFLGDVIERYRKKLNDLKTAYAKPSDAAGFSNANSTSMLPQNGSPVNSPSLQKESMNFPPTMNTPIVQKPPTPAPVEPMKQSLGQKLMSLPETIRGSMAEKNAMLAQGMRQGMSDTRPAGYEGVFHPEASKVAQENMNNLVMGSTGEMNAVGKSVGKALKPAVRSLADDAASKFKPVADDVFGGLKGLSTKIIEKLKGKKTVSKQFITDLTNSGDVKQVERDLIRRALEKEGDKINVQQFADKVSDELLPLERGPVRFGGIEGGFTKPGDVLPPKYESITLPEELRGNVGDYREIVYQSPIKTSAGGTHFSETNTPNYFGHTRIEDMADGKTRRVIEVQSDLYQKGRLEGEVDDTFRDMAPDEIKEMQKYDPINYKVYQATLDREKEVAKLSQYNDPTAHFRMVREEIKKAAEDGKTDVLFPTGETAMKVEGLGQRADSWVIPNPDELANDNWLPLKTDMLAIGKQVTDKNYDEWVITEVLEDGKFKAVPKWKHDQYGTRELPGGGRVTGPNLTDADSELFDISGKVDQNNPIYKFYEKEMSKYLKSKYGAQQIVDENGVSWMKVPIKPEYSKAPVEAFIAPIVAGAGAAAAVNKSDEK